MTSASSSVVGVACGIFRTEIQSLRSAGRIGIPFRYLSSMLHMAPDGLDRQAQTLVAAERRHGNGVVLAYGDCSPHMLEIEASPGVARTSGINCCEIMLGRRAYRELRSKGAFFIMPEWALRWREIFESGLGLDGKNARAFMTDMHTGLLYLDTGLVPVPEAVLAEMADYCGLPWELLPLPLDHLLESLGKASERIGHHD